MTKNEITLLNLIREQDNPERAIEIAIHIMIEFLVQDESSQEPPPAYAPVFA